MDVFLAAPSTANSSLSSSAGHVKKSHDLFNLLVTVDDLNAPQSNPKVYGKKI